MATRLYKNDQLLPEIIAPQVRHRRDSDYDSEADEEQEEEESAEDFVNSKIERWNDELARVVKIPIALIHTINQMYPYLCAATNCIESTINSMDYTNAPAMSDNEMLSRFISQVKIATENIMLNDEEMWKLLACIL